MHCGNRASISFVTKIALPFHAGGIGGFCTSSTKGDFGITKLVFVNPDLSFFTQDKNLFPFCSCADLAHREQLKAFVAKHSGPGDDVPGPGDWI